MKKIFLLFVLLLFSQNTLYSQYNYSAKWFLFYKEQGGMIQKSIGPFNSKLECEAARYNRLPFGAQYIGCFQ